MCMSVIVIFILRVCGPRQSVAFYVASGVATVGWCVVRLLVSLVIVSRVGPDLVVLLLPLASSVCLIFFSPLFVYGADNHREKNRPSHMC